MAKQLARELINAGVHFGHGVSRWNPKMAPFIFAKRGNIHIIDVKKTLKGILIAKKLLAEIVSSGNDVVFVGTKRQAQKAVEAAAKRCGMHFVSERWLGGMLTNFRTIRSRLQRLEQLEAMEQDGSLEAESKKQASRLKREMRKIRTNLDGVRKMSRLPGVIVVVDAKKEYLALREAAKLGIPTAGILDTDSDPDSVDVAIPANDDSIRAVEIILNELADAVAIGKTMVSVRQQETEPRQRRARPSRRPTLARADGAAAHAVATVDEQTAESEEETTQPEPSSTPEEPAPRPEDRAPQQESDRPSSGT
ncbi:MAG: 30S ribosomal protein S2 [Sedimentisphaerales bacterium]|nr:30S ribosomal protein S2 [Sedimentisphaerales bacterium]